MRWRIHPVELLRRCQRMPQQGVFRLPSAATSAVLFGILFETYLQDIETENRSSVIFTGFLENMSQEYLDNCRKEEIVRDFIAGMTDQYFLRQCPEDMRPEISFH